METTKRYRRRCDRCQQWSWDLVEVKSELGPDMPYYVHAEEVVEMKALVKEARAQIKAEKAKALATYGQRYAHGGRR